MFPTQATIWKPAHFEDDMLILDFAWRWINVFLAGDNFLREDKCVKVPIFGNVGLGIILEILRALFFHLGSPACMTYLLYKSRGKLKYLKTLKVSKNPITLEKLKRVRFILSYSMFFIIFWVPFGLLFTFYRIFEAFRKSSASGEQNQDLKKSTSDSLSLITIGLYTGIACFYIYIVFSPVIVLWTGDGRLRQQFVNLLRRGACEIK
ncbi:uncharacterized protein LOC118438280 [Folsomia candida]|uniref:uncharacterized protein LOC118438280 n=1 Tax=Folsomia candida TaxID=158441 RepID=UPI001604BA53|nr:uncharacterized protein LOC118438280 [Folsomia candida]